MKKLLLLGTMLLVLGVVTSAKEVTPVPEKIKGDYTINVSAGVSPISDYSADGTTVDGDGAGFEVSVEAMKEIKHNWYVGLGVGFHNLADGETKLGGHNIGEYKDYESYPVYLTTKYNFFALKDGIRPYVKADLGYAFNRSVEYGIMGEHGKEGVDNGIYAGVGFGVEQNNINAGLMFKTTQGEINGDNCDNYRVVLTVGYDFDFNI